MRVSVNWLHELVDLPKGTTPGQIAEKLTSTGLEVEAVEDLAAPLHGVVVGRVASTRPHPQAERLKLCVVEAGGTAVDVVCGATNVTEGALVCFATPGTVLPGGKRIEVAPVRGIVSNGMLCSASELGLESSSDGLLLLKEGEPGVAIGAPVAQAVGRDDVVLTLGVTPNRPDALSHNGVARELAAAFRTRLRLPTPACPERGGPIETLANVTVEDADGCPRYTCRVIESIAVGPSPGWLVARLAACGVRSINNVVDVTNLVMMERGLPLHAFDFDKIEQAQGRASIVVRNAVAGDKLVTLDGKERELIDGDVVIADAKGAIALAGVMGGATTEVSQGTTRVLLEAAYFSPGRIRRTARRLALHSEASHRFERGCDPNGVLPSLDRAAALLADIAGGGKDGARVARGVVDAYPKKIMPAVVTLRPKHAAAVLGVPPKLVDEANASKLLLALGLEVEGREAEAVRFRVPTYRPDITREIDLIEELLRLIGTDAVPATLPTRAAEAESLFDKKRHRTLGLVRKALLAAGYDEAINLAFVSPSSLDAFDGGDHASRVSVRNPLGEEHSVLRRSLLPGLIGNAATNHRRGVLDVRLFETATVFLGRNPAGRVPRLDGREGPAGQDSWAREVPRLGGIATGAAALVGFDRRSAALDFFDVKGHLEELFGTLGIGGGVSSPVSFVAADDRYPFLHPRARAEVWVKHQDQPVFCGVLGELHPDLVHRHELRSRPIVFEVDMDVLARVSPTVVQAKSLPRFPAVRRDFAWVLDQRLLVSDFCNRIADNGVVRDLLERIEVFDVYQGEHVPVGKKSVAIALTLRAGDRTLADDEITRISSALIDDVRAHFGAEVRG